MITNIARSVYHDPKKGEVEYTTPSDFLIKWGEEKSEQKPEPKKQTVDEMKQILMGIASTFNKKEGK